MDKQILVHPYNGITIHNKKKNTSDTSNDIDESKNEFCSSKKEASLKKATSCLTPVVWRSWEKQETESKPMVPRGNNV